MSDSPADGRCFVGRCDDCVPVSKRALIAELKKIRDLADNYEAAGRASALITVIKGAKDE